eukprot:6482408-Amphidinium_carterae.1
MSRDISFSAAHVFGANWKCRVKLRLCRSMLGAHGSKIAPMRGSRTAATATKTNENKRARSLMLPHCTKRGSRCAVCVQQQLHLTAKTVLDCTVSRGRCHKIQTSCMCYSILIECQSLPVLDTESLRQKFLACDKDKSGDVTMRPAKGQSTCAFVD